MNSKHISYRCPKCGKVLEKSELPDYVYQCMDCDEDFYSIEAVEVTTTFTEHTEEDQKRYNECGFHVDLSERLKVTVTDGRNHSGFCFMLKSDIDLLGMEYIKDHAILSYSSISEEYHVEISKNDYYNDLTRNPEKVIPLEFVEIEWGTGREVYKGIENGRYYLREVSSREDFARWYVCGMRRTVDDGNPPRANLIFKCGDETEKVTYHDWNGVCAYSNTFNRNFRRS